MLAQRVLQEIIILEKFIENRCSQNGRRRDVDIDSIKAIVHIVPSKKPADKGQAAPFTAERPFTDTDKIALQIELPARKITDNAELLFVTKSPEGADQVTPDSFSIFKFRDFSRAQAIGQIKLGSGHQPVRKMVAIGVEDKRFFRYFRETFFHGMKIAGPGRHTSIGKPEYEITEAEIPPDKSFQFSQQGRGFFM